MLLEEKEFPALFAFVRAIADGDDFDAGLGDSLIVEAEFFRGAWGDIEMATGDEWAAVVDADFKGISVLEIGDFNEARQGKCFMSAC